MTAMLADIISRFGKDVHAKLNDLPRLASLRTSSAARWRTFIADINALIGKEAGEGIRTIGEVRLPNLMTRPDYAGNSGRVDRLHRGQGARKGLGPHSIPGQVSGPPPVGKVEIAAKHHLHGRQRLHSLA